MQIQKMKLENKYSVLIIGLGNIGMKYDFDDNSNKKLLSHAKSFYSHKMFELTGGVDLNKKNREEFTKKYKCEAFENIKETELKINPDIIIVSTPTIKHYENIKEIVNIFRPKIVICEKPISYNLIEAKEIVELCNLKNIKLYVNYFRRTLPGNLKILSFINSKVFEVPFNGFCIYSKGLFNSASHFIDLFQFFFGKVIDIKLISKNKIKQDPEPDFKLEFSKGTITFISNQNNSIFINYADIILQNGKLTFDNSGSEVLWRTVQKDDRFKGYNIIGNDSQEFKNDFNRIQKYFTEQIYLAINNKENYLCTGQDALKTQNILEKIKLKL